jgi:hypothetical protein
MMFFENNKYAHLTDETKKEINIKCYKYLGSLDGKVPLETAYVLTKDYRDALCEKAEKSDIEYQKHISEIQASMLRVTK